MALQGVAGVDQDALLVTRLLATALSDPEVRHRLYLDLRRSPFPEGKLPLQQYVGSVERSTLRASLGEGAEGDPRGLTGILDALPQMEIYLPVPEHRSSWSGGGEILIATLASGSREPTAFATGTDGPISLSPTTPPSTPVLAVVPAEARFGWALDPSKFDAWLRSGDASGTEPVIMADECDPETQFEPCDDEDTGGMNFSWGSAPAGLYVTKSYIPGSYEAWIRGDPEYEMHLVGPTVAVADSAETVRCAGEHAADTTSQFDQNGSYYDWQPVRVASESELSDFTLSWGDTVGHQLAVWEDDYVTCDIRSDRDEWDAAADAAQDLYDAQAAVRAAVDGTGASTIVEAAKAVWDAIMSVGHWLATDDDFVGLAVEESCSLGQGNGSGNFALKVDDGSGGMTTVGCIQVVAHDPD